METWQLIVLVVIGVIAGILNVIAGGGSLLTLPVMVLMGMDGPVANGSNRVAICAQNVSAIAGFKSKGFSDFRLSLSLAMATIPGAIAGAILGVKVGGVLFNRILAVIMILIMIQLMWKQRGASKQKTRPAESALPTRRQNVFGHLCMIGVGFYGGFIQAGVGFLLIASLHNVMGLDLIRVNMHKVFIVGAFTFVALVVFIIDDKVRWIPGLALAAGTSIGGWIGSHLSVTKGERLIRAVLFAALAAMAVKLLFLR
jgi:uncharacterized membrane protein YfcA